jgi:hypothetical protein
MNATNPDRLCREFRKNSLKSPEGLPKPVSYPMGMRVQSLRRAS